MRGIRRATHSVIMIIIAAIMIASSLSLICATANCEIGEPPRQLDLALSERASIFSLGAPNLYTGFTLSMAFSDMLVEEYTQDHIILRTMYLGALDLPFASYTKKLQHEYPGHASGCLISDYSYGFTFSTPWDLFDSPQAEIYSKEGWSAEELVDISISGMQATLDMARYCKRQMYAYGYDQHTALLYALVKTDFSRYVLDTTESQAATHPDNDLYFYRYGQRAMYDGKYVSKSDLDKAAIWNLCDPLLIRAVFGDIIYDHIYLGDSSFHAPKVALYTDAKLYPAGVAYCLGFDTMYKGHYCSLGLEYGEGPDGIIAGYTEEVSGIMLTHNISLDEKAYVGAQGMEDGICLSLRLNKHITDETTFYIQSGYKTDIYVPGEPDGAGLTTFRFGFTHLI